MDSNGVMDPAGLAVVAGSDRPTFDPADAADAESCGHHSESVGVPTIGMSGFGDRSASDGLRPAAATEEPGAAGGNGGDEPPPDTTSTALGDDDDSDAEDIEFVGQQKEQEAPGADVDRLLSEIRHAAEVVATGTSTVDECLFLIDDACLLPIAQRSFGTPRLAIRLMESVHRTARAEGSPAILVEHLERTLSLEQLDELGLGSDEQRYLKLLADARGPVRLGVLASKLKASSRTVSHVVEEKLIYLDLIERLPQGRVLSQKGVEYLSQEKEGPRV
jgi:hypothetical protein